MTEMIDRLAVTINAHARLLAVPRLAAAQSDMSGLQSGYGGGMSRYGAEGHAQLKHGRTPR
jgi:hypothetical protein